MISFHIPDDRELLAVFGEVAVRHEHLNYILRMTIKTLANLGIEEALDATAYDGSRQLRDRVRKLARKRLGESEALLKLQALLKRCERATDRRNELMHGIWAKELDGEALRQTDNHEWHPLPTTAELNRLSLELKALIEELNTARLEGFIFEVLSSARGQ